MGIKKFSESINSNKFQEVIDSIKDLIEKTINKSGGEYKTFIDGLLKEPNDYKIEGLINESDIYEFYLKYRNQIDECLNDIKYYDEVPSESNIFSLYDFIIKGTMRSVEEFIKDLS